MLQLDMFAAPAPKPVARKAPDPRPAAPPKAPTKVPALATAPVPQAPEPVLPPAPAPTETRPAEPAPVSAEAVPGRRLTLKTECKNALKRAFGRLEFEVQGREVTITRLKGKAEREVLPLKLIIICGGDAVMVMGRRPDGKECWRPGREIPMHLDKLVSDFKVCGVE